MDHVNKTRRSWIMSRIKSSGNATNERRLYAIMRQLGIRGWRRKTELFGRPDFVFTKKQVCVFADGDFWHGHPTKSRLPRTNRKYWRRKRDAAVRRDRVVTRKLRQDGWTVLRFWESELRDDEEVVAAKLAFYLT